MSFVNTGGLLLAAIQRDTHCHRRVYAKSDQAGGGVTGSGRADKHQVQEMMRRQVVIRGNSDFQEEGVLLKFFGNGVLLKFFRKDGC